MPKAETLEFIKQSFTLKEQGFYKPAIVMLYKALDIDPDNIEILAQLAQIYKLLGEEDRTAQYIEKVLEIDNNHIDSLKLLLEIYEGKNNLEKATEIAQKICSIQPVNENYAKCLNLMKQTYDFATITDFINSIENPNSNVICEIAEIYNENNKEKEAISILEKDFNTTQETKTMTLLAKLYYQTEQQEKASELFNKLEAKAPTAETMNYIGLINLELSKTETAINYFNKAHRLDNQNAEYIYNLASAYFINGWLDEAAQSFHKAICLDPMNINYHYSLAYLLYQQEKYKKSQCELETVLEIDKDFKQAKILNSLITAKTGDLLSAKQELEAATKDENADDFTYYALSTVYKELSFKEKSREAIEKALTFKDNSITYLTDYLDIEMELKNYENADKIADRILNINENYIHAYKCKAIIKYEKGDFENLYNAAQAMIELDDNSAEGYYYNSIALFEQDDKDFAMESLKKAISLDLNNAVLYIKMSEFKQKTGNIQSAYVWAREAAEIDERNYQYKWLCAKLAQELGKKEEAQRQYSQGYILNSQDEEMNAEYVEFLKSIGRTEQANRILNSKR